MNATDSSVLLAGEANLRAFQLKATAGALTDVLEMRLLVTDPATGETKRYERTVEMNLQANVPRHETSAWYPLSQPFELRPGTRPACGAGIEYSGHVGSVTHDFDVPERKGMRPSSLIVTDTIETPAQGSEGPPKPV